MKKDKISHEIKYNGAVIRSPDNLNNKRLIGDIKVINREKLSRFP